jgi:hypothetical protein
MYDLNIEGSTSESELIQISKWASQVPAGGIIVEVGSFKGRSAYAWAASCDNSIKVFCLDFFRKWFYREFIENMKGVTNVTPIRCNVPYYMDDWIDQEIDIFFLDGAHTNPQDLDAINYFLPLIKKGGILCGHDYYPIDNNTPNVTDNIKMLEERLDQKVQTFEGTSLWAFNI